ncbi:MAG TPA: right-handed parallel beta-helix repeat-containing protein [Rhabdochlamydiaceae bacterium]|nr:right-handed parallel beta-helix repeat-containing protein [Rhabdochlamydiaceae bacterium]
MGRFLILVACFFSVFLNAKENTFSRGRLKGFYEQFFCEEKQVLYSADLTAPCAFWVSPNGNDAASGTKQDPFLTLQRARDAVRALPSSARNQDIYIYIKEGTYRLQQPLVLNGSDSGQNGYNVIYSAAPEGDPIISGAVQVTGWTLHDVPLGIYRAFVGPRQSRQLYVNGTRAVRARTTPYPAAFLPNFASGGIEFIPTTLNPAQWRDPSTWTNPQDIEAVIQTQWKMMRVPLSSITPYNPPANGLITMQEPAWNNANVYYDATTNMPGVWSFWQVTWFENAYQFLDQPGQWYLDSVNGWLYYIPLPGEDLSTADVELPILETLIAGQGTANQPIHNIRFVGLTFSYATWLGPNGPNGYVSDQSGMLLIGTDHQPNIIGHDQHVVPTPGNLPFTFAENIVFYGNIFEHLGAVGLQFGTGSKNNTIDSNLFNDISSAAIELGAVSTNDARPSSPVFIVQDHIITNNLITSVAAEFVDAAGIFVGFTMNTTISQNTISNVPWSGIAMGWGWGLLDKGSFPGLGHAFSGEWGTFNTDTINSGSRIVQNRIQNFLNVLWDGGAIYTTGQQGPSLYGGGLIIEGNVASGKPTTPGGGNVFYTDGGSRYIRLLNNVSYNNPIGVTFFGPPPPAGDPLPYSFIPSLGNNLPYGSDSGGCVTYGDLQYIGNYWLQAPIPEEEVLFNILYKLLLGFGPYSSTGFFDVCPFTYNGVSYPVNLSFENNVSISSVADVPSFLLSNAGVQTRPVTIPPNKWVVP